ncbi:unnamed protein product [Sphagnum tenellum]
MKLVWHANNLIEEDWFRYILGDLIDQEIIDLKLTCFDDNSIRVVSNAWAPLESYAGYFQECRAKCQRIILVHVSDEYFSGGYSLYQYFDLVIRWNHSYLTNHNGIITVPLGYTNGTGHGNVPVEQRKFAWSFVGEIKSSRIAMISAFDSLTPQFVTGTDSIAKPSPIRLDKREFDAILADSVFAPCPMGNATIDTNRVYESLEFGCIPLVEVRPTLDYYTKLFGSHPLPTFHNWKDARRYAEELFNDKPSLLEKQAEIVNWWRMYKTNMCAATRSAITGPSQSADLQVYANKLRNRFSLVHEPLRIAEILRHQTLDSFVRRISRPVGPIKRIMRESMQIGKGVP